MANTDIVFRMYDLFGKGDMETIKTEVFHPDIVWHMPGHHPLSGNHTGADEVVAFFGALFQAGIQVDDTHFGELDNGIVVEKHMGHGSVDGETYLFPTSTTYRIEDGKLREVQVHTADQHGVDRYMWKAFSLLGVGERLKVPAQAGA